MDFPFRIPGTTEPEITISRSALGNVSVHVNGQQLKRRGRGLRYDIPLPDGTATELEVTGQWRGLKAKVNGVETALEPPVSPIYVLLIFLPLALVAVGGLIGGLVGVFTSMANMVISRRRLAAPLKLAAMVSVVAVGIAVWFVVCVRDLAIAEGRDRRLPERGHARRAGGLGYRSAQPPTRGLRDGA